MAVETKQGIADVGFEIPAIFTNRFIINATPDVVRISFGEAPGDPTKTRYHSAVALSVNDAGELAEALVNTLHRVKLAIAADVAANRPDPQSEDADNAET